MKRSFSEAEQAVLYDHIERNKGNESIWLTCRKEALKAVKFALEAVRPFDEACFTDKQIKNKISNQASYHHYKLGDVFRSGPVACGLYQKPYQISNDLDVNLRKRKKVVSRGKTTKVTIKRKRRLSPEIQNKHDEQYSISDTSELTSLSSSNGEVSGSDEATTPTSRAGHRHRLAFKEKSSNLSPKTPRQHLQTSLIQQTGVQQYLSPYAITGSLAPLTTKSRKESNLVLASRRMDMEMARPEPPSSDKVEKAVGDIRNQIGKAVSQFIVAQNVASVSNKHLSRNLLVLSRVLFGEVSELELSRTLRLFTSRHNFEVKEILSAYIAAAVTQWVFIECDYLHSECDFVGTSAKRFLEDAAPEFYEDLHRLEYTTYLETVVRPSLPMRAQRLRDETIDALVRLGSTFLDVQTGLRSQLLQERENATREYDERVASVFASALDLRLQFERTDLKYQFIFPKHKVAFEPTWMDPAVPGRDTEGGNRVDVCMFPAIFNINPTDSEGPEQARVKVVSASVLLL